MILLLHCELFEKYFFIFLWKKENAVKKKECSLINLNQKGLEIDWEIAFFLQNVYVRELVKDMSMSKTCLRNIIFSNHYVITSYSK